MSWNWPVAKAAWKSSAIIHHRDFGPDISGFQGFVNQPGVSGIVFQVKNAQAVAHSPQMTGSVK